VSSASSTIPAQGLAGQLVIGGEKNYIVYCFFGIFLINIIIIIVIPLFVILLNCLQLSPQVLHFVHSLPRPTDGAEGVSE